jgi:hypothetical protein
MSNFLKRRFLTVSLSDEVIPPFAASFFFGIVTGAGNEILMAAAELLLFIALVFSVVILGVVGAAVFGAEKSNEKKSSFDFGASAGFTAEDEVLFLGCPVFAKIFVNGSKLAELLPCLAMTGEICAEFELEELGDEISYP